jgi:DNA-binding HxlR family transcriptional regulator
MVKENGPHDTCELDEIEAGSATEVHFCPMNAALTLLNGRWTPHIVHALLSGQTRFNEIARQIGINPRTLRERLKEMEEEGVVKRRVLCQMPPSVEYTLTDKGRALENVFKSLAEWGMRWLEPPKAH